MTTILKLEKIREKVSEIVEKTADITSKKKAGKFNILKKDPKNRSRLSMYRLLEILENRSKQIVLLSIEIERLNEKIEKKKEESKCADTEKKRLYLKEESILSNIKEYDRTYKQMKLLINTDEEINEQFLRDIKSKPKSKSKSKQNWRKEMIKEYEDMEETIDKLEKPILLSDFDTEELYKEMETMFKKSESTDKKFLQESKPKSNLKSKPKRKSESKSNSKSKSESKSNSNSNSKSISAVDGIFPPGTYNFPSVAKIAKWIEQNKKNF